MEDENTLAAELFEKYLQPELDKLQSSIVKQLTKEEWNDINEKHRKMYTGEWDGPETPYVKVIKDLYKSRDWSEKD